MDQRYEKIVANNFPYFPCFTDYFMVDYNVIETSLFGIYVDLWSDDKRRYRTTDFEE